MQRLGRENPRNFQGNLGRGEILFPLARYLEQVAADFFFETPGRFKNNSVKTVKRRSVFRCNF